MTLCVEYIPEEMLRYVREIKGLFAGFESRDPPEGFLEVANLIVEQLVSEGHGCRIVFDPLATGGASTCVARFQPSERLLELMLALRAYEVD